MIKTGMSFSYEKQPGTNTLSEKLRNTLHLYMAKNEGESLRITLLSDTPEKGLKLIFEGNTDLKTELFAEAYIPWDGKNLPDPLCPVTEFSLNPDMTLNILVRFLSNENTAPGDKKIRARLINGKNETLHEYDIDITVWNITLPKTPAMASHILIYKDIIAMHHGMGDMNSMSDTEREKLDELYTDYYELLLSYGISGGELPYDILDPRVDKYLSDPRVTAFSVPFEVSDEILVSYYNKLKSNPTWFAKSLIYIFDEPINPEHMEILREREKRVRRLCPDFKILTTICANFDLDNGNDAVEELINSLEVLTIKPNCLDDNYMYTEERAKNYPSMMERMKAFKNSGNTLWSYVCWEPGRPYANLFVDGYGLDHRILFWQQYDFGSTGFLYWAANYWREVDDPWKNMSTVPWLDKTVLGDGSLLYNGNKIGVKGACPSLRLELIRDGLEDFTLLTMAEKTLGKEFVNGIVDRVSTSTVSFTEETDVFESARRELGQALEKAYSDGCR